jgi:hypothetical protein
VRQRTLFDDITNEHLEKLLFELLLFTTKCTTQPELYDVFALSKQDIILQIIFILLRTTPKELELFRDRPDEFVSLAVDTCDKQVLFFSRKKKQNSIKLLIFLQNSMIVKTQSAQLLENMCDHIDGAMTLVGHTCVQIMQFSLTCDDVLQIATKFPELQPLVGHPFLDKTVTSAELRTETCFMALSVMSYLLPKRHDLVRLLEIFLRQQLQNFLGPQMPPLLKARFCMFIGYYADVLFYNE